MGLIPSIKYTSYGSRKLFQSLKFQILDLLCNFKPTNTESVKWTDLDSFLVKSQIMIKKPCFQLKFNIWTVDM